MNVVRFSHSKEVGWKPLNPSSSQVMPMDCVAVLVLLWTAKVFAYLGKKY